MLLLVADFTHLAPARASRLLIDPVMSVDIEYPTTTGNVAGETLTVEGKGKHAIFQLGNGRALSTFTQLLDPTAQACQTLIFLQGGLGTIGSSDFVYAIKVDYTGSANADMDILRVGRCRGGTITSVGYCSQSGVVPSVVDTLNKPLGVDFSFLSPFVKKDEKTAMLFYTSPYPPDTVPTFIASTPVASQGKVPGTPSPGPGDPVQSPIYGPCQVLEIVKEVACTDAKGAMSRFGPGPISVIKGTGAKVVYQFTVKNHGKTDLANVMITDTLLGFTGAIPTVSPCTTPACNEAKSLSTTILADNLPVNANGKLTNTASAKADYNIPVQNGVTPSGQIASISAGSNSVEVTVGTTGLCGTTTKCDTICFRPPILCQIFLNRLPAGTILIGGVNNNNPINIQTNGTLIRNALIPCPISICTLTPLQYLNQQFVAAQLSLAAVGGPSSPVGINALWSNLNCYSTLTNFRPVQLSNGVTLTPNSMLKDLFEQARKAITENRTADMAAIADLLKLLNSTCNKSTI